MISAALDIQDVNEQVLQQLLNDESLRDRANGLILRAVYDKLRT